MKLFYLCLGAFALALSGCAVGPKAPFSPGQGIVFSNTTAPLSVEYGNTVATGLRTGKASASNVLGLFSFGDCGIRAAAEEGGLRTVEFVDYTNFNVLGIYQETTVTVYGK